MDFLDEKKQQLQSPFEMRKMAMSEDTMLVRMDKSARSMNTIVKSEEGTKNYRHFYDWKYDAATAPLTQREMNISNETMVAINKRIEATNVEKNDKLKKQLAKDFSNISGRSSKERMKKVKKMNKLMNEYSGCSKLEYKINRLNADLDKRKNSHKETAKDQTDRLDFCMARIQNRIKMIDLSRDYQHEFIKAYGKKDALENEKLTQMHYEFAVKKGAILSEYEHAFTVDEKDSKPVVKLKQKYNAMVRDYIKNSKAEQMKCLKEYDNVLKKRGVQNAIIKLDEDVIKDLKAIESVNPVDQKRENRKITNNEKLGPYIRKALRIRSKHIENSNYHGDISSLFYINKYFTETQKTAMMRLFNESQDDETIGKNLVDLLWEIQEDIVEAGYGATSKAEAFRVRKGRQIRDAMIELLQANPTIEKAFDEAWDQKGAERSLKAEDDWAFRYDDEVVYNFTYHKKLRTEPESAEEEIINTTTKKNSEIKEIKAKNEQVVPKQKQKSSSNVSNGKAIKKEKDNKALYKTASGQEAEIIDVTQDRFQTKNRCWAFSLSNILKARGINIDPDAFAKEVKTKKPAFAKRIDNGNYFSIEEVGELVQEHLNKSGFNLYSINVTKTENGDKKAEQAMAENRIHEVVDIALKGGSTVTLFDPYRQHYITVVGMTGDNGSQTLLYKDSLKQDDEIRQSNDVLEMKLSDFVKRMGAKRKDGSRAEYGISMSWTGKVLPALKDGYEAFATQYN